MKTRITTNYISGKANPHADHGVLEVRIEVFEINIDKTVLIPIYEEGEKQNDK